MRNVALVLIATICLSLGTNMLIAPTHAATSEQVFVKYRGQVNLTPFDCEWITRSSLVNRVCYDSKEQYLVVNLSGTYYHYCEIPANIVSVWKQADSMGRFYNAKIKGNFDCRVKRMPAY